MSQQPVWRYVANLGDADPFQHGGVFVFVDETGVYPPEMESLELEDPDNSNCRMYYIHRVVLEPCTYINGILSDDKFHKDYPVWFAARDPEHLLRHHYDQWKNFCQVAEGIEKTPDEFAAMFCSGDPVILAWAYLEIIQYHGWHEFDHANH